MHNGGNDIFRKKKNVHFNDLNYNTKYVITSVLSVLRIVLYK